MRMASAILTSASIVFALAAVAAGDARGQDRPPNVVLIVADDIGYADLSIHGSESIATPRIDSIARAGVRFTNGYVVSPLCSPSRAGLLTGRYPQRFGHEFNPPRVRDPNAGLPLSAVTLAEMLRARGYRTEAIGKWHLGAARRQQPMRRGFDHFYGFLKGMRSYRPGNASVGRAILRDGKRVPEKFEYLTDEFGREAVAAIERNRSAPFFLYVSFNATHAPLEADPAVLAEVPEGESLMRRTLIAMTRSLDGAVGMILDAIDVQGLRDETIVFFLSDNGGAAGNASRNAPFRGRKWTLYEGGVRVPFFMRWGGRVPPGQTFDAPVSSLDVAATVLAATGAPAADENRLDGVDLVPYVRGERDAPPHARLHWRMGKSWAIRDGTLKMVANVGRPPLLFDLRVDPSEATDLASERPADVQRLWDAHLDWASTLSAPLWKFQFSWDGVKPRTD